MRNLLLAFLFLTFVVSASVARTKVIKNHKIEVYGDDDKKCNKKNCKHKTKECADHKKECKKGEKKTCCAKKDKAKNSCCAKGKAKSCNKSKSSLKEGK